MAEHARLSPSAASRWIACPGSLALEESLGIKDEGSSYAAEGSTAHELAELALTHPSKQTITFLNQKSKRYGIVYDEDMCEEVQKFVDLVLEVVGDGNLLVEQRVDYSHYSGVPDSFGTSDAIIITPDGEEICVVDLKYGKGVAVYAERNEQLMCYALGAMHTFSALGNYKRARMIISQPRINNTSEWDCDVEELLEFAEDMRDAALTAVKCADTKVNDLTPYLNPGDKQCMWCKAKAHCPALAGKVRDTVGVDFADLTLTNDVKKLVPVDAEALSFKMMAVEVIEDWCKAVRGAVETMLLKGQSVYGFKLVEGKKGNRKWSSEAEAEAALKAMRLKQEEMYEYSLITPTKAEKLFKDNPKRWAKLEALITRSEGKPHVAPVSDKRPPINLAPDDDFTDLNKGE